MANATTTYQDDLVSWYNERKNILRSPEGWLRLAGLYWLEEGENRFGSDPSNDIVFPEGKAPSFIGTIWLENGRISTKILSDVAVTVNEEPITDFVMLADRDEGGPTILHYGRLSWFVIRRGDQYAVRLRDLDSPYFQQFSGIETFAFDPDWRIEATFEPYEPPKEVDVPNVLGHIEKRHSPGALVFMVAGQMQRLDVLNSLEWPSVVFADATTAKETYGGGRFLIVGSINPDGPNYVDFNKAINPPCAFSPYATCPLPPAQNRLTVAIRAGEKKYHY